MLQLQYTMHWRHDCLPKASMTLREAVDAPKIPAGSAMTLYIYNSPCARSRRDGTQRYSLLQIEKDAKVCITYVEMLRCFCNRPCAAMQRIPMTDAIPSQFLFLMHVHFGSNGWRRSSTARLIVCAECTTFDGATLLACVLAPTIPTEIVRYACT